MNLVLRSCSQAVPIVSGGGGMRDNESEMSGARSLFSAGLPARDCGLRDFRCRYWHYFLAEAESADESLSGRSEPAAVL
jgi:hypothetical protein